MVGNGAAQVSKRGRRRRAADELPAPKRAGRRLVSVTVGAVNQTDRLEVRASLTLWGGQVRAHLRTWYRAPDGCWYPTARGVSVAPAQLEALEAMVRSLREAYAAGILGPPPSTAEIPPCDAAGALPGAPGPAAKPERPASR